MSKRRGSYRKPTGNRASSKICKYCANWNTKSQECYLDLKIHKAGDRCFNWIKRTRKDTLLEMMKRTFSYERNTGIVYVSTVPLITERWRNGERQIISFMVTLPEWISEERILEAINDGFGFLKEETE